MRAPGRGITHVTPSALPREHLRSIVRARLELFKITQTPKLRKPGGVDRGEHKRKITVSTGIRETGKEGREQNDNQIYCSNAGRRRVDSIFRGPLGRADFVRRLEGSAGHLGVPPLGRGEGEEECQGETMIMSPPRISSRE